MTTTRPVDSPAPHKKTARRVSMVVEKDVVLSLRLTAKLCTLVDAVAEETGLTRLDWIRAVLARAANEGAFAPRKGDVHGKRKRRTN
jgi:hypothetical protein